MPRGGGGAPPFVRWPEFLAQWKWGKPKRGGREIEGEHIVIIGPTGSGKTLLTRLLLRRSPLPWVVVFGIKRRDRELYQAYQKEGYELARTFDADVPDNADYMRVLFVPQTNETGDEGLKARAQKFKEAFGEIERAGNWTVSLDDVIVITREMGLYKAVRNLWIEGRSAGISVVSSAQEPVGIPPMAYSQATHLFIFKNPDMYRVRRLSELTGFNKEVAFEVIPRLPQHEFLWIQKDTGEMLRSRAEP